MRRIYALNDEAGTLICQWPDDTYKPVTPAPYSEETWPGLEYATAALMIQEGMVTEGLKLVSAVRARFDGEKRNPWNEFECGSNYARSMSSFSLLYAFSGFLYDMTKGLIGFDPKTDGDFFYSLDSGWGKLKKSPNGASVEVLYGFLKISELYMPFMGSKPVICRMGTKALELTQIGTGYRFIREVHIKTGQTISITQNDEHLL